MANINLRIKEVAKEHGYTLSQLAEKLGVKAQTISQDIYRGSFSIEKLGSIADIIGVTVPELFEAYKQPKEEGAASVCPHCGKPIKVVVCKAD